MSVVSQLAGDAVRRDDGSVAVFAPPSNGSGKRRRTATACRGTVEPSDGSALPMHAEFEGLPKAGCFPFHSRAAAESTFRAAVIALSCSMARRLLRSNRDSIGTRIGRREEIALLIYAA